MNLEELRTFADEVGIGYKGLDEDSLLKRIILEGEPRG